MRSFQVVIRADPDLCDPSFAPVPKLWADGYFNDFSGGEGYQYLDGFFKADGSATGELDNATQVDACDYRIMFTAHRVDP